jgi:hypothetical protein
MSACTRIGIPHHGPIPRDEWRVKPVTGGLHVEFVRRFTRCEPGQRATAVAALDHGSKSIRVLINLPAVTCPDCSDEQTFSIEVTGIPAGTYTPVLGANDGAPLSEPDFGTHDKPVTVP